MSRRSLVAAAALCVFQSVASQLSAVPAFPGAEGWGASTPGGRGGKVYIVTNKNPKGPGSLNAALRAKGPRIIVFRVSGVVAKGGCSLGEANSYVTVAGQTSPGGITLMDGAYASYHVKFHDGVFRFLNLRTAGNRYAMSMAGVHHVIQDHCSYSGGWDEISPHLQSPYLTFQWCTWAHPEGGAPYGESEGTKSLLIAYAPHHVTIHHCLFVHAGGRTPYYHSIIKYGMLEHVNNVVYNGGGFITQWPKCEYYRLNVIGNLFSARNRSVYRPISVAGKGTAKLYEHNNCVEGPDGKRTYSDATHPLVRKAYTEPPTYVDRPWTMSEHPVTVHKVDKSYDLVLDKAGAWPRDAMYRKAIKDVRGRTGQMDCRAVLRFPLLDYEDEFCPQPPDDKDLDGMADAWEVANGLDPKNSSDSGGDFDKTGYTNIEKHINDLAHIWMNEPVRYRTGGVWAYYNQGYTHEPVKDATAPSVPGNLAGKALSETAIKLTWTGSSDRETGVLGYLLKRDGARVGLLHPTLRAYKDDGLTEGRKYTYTLQALNLAKVASPATAVSVSTLADTAPPRIVWIAPNVSEISIRFSEPLKKAGAEDKANYGRGISTSLSQAQDIESRHE